jgi:hypothetical protein
MSISFNIFLQIWIRLSYTPNDSKAYKKKDDQTECKKYTCVKLLKFKSGHWSSLLVKRRFYDEHGHTG